MEKHKVKILLISIYSFLMLFCVGVLYYNYNHLYNRVTVLENREEIIKKSQLSIPLKIVIFNDSWGSYVFEDEQLIQKIWKALNDITGGPAEVAPSYPLKDDVKIQGRIEYLNGSSECFEIGSRLVLNGQVYNDNYKMPLIDNLKNDLLWYLYSQKQIAKIVGKAAQIKIYTHGNKEYRWISDREREPLKELLEQAVKLESNREITRLLKYKGEALAHVRIYLQPEKMGKIQAADMINIDIYGNNFFIVQYMGDENGRHLYFQGNLNMWLKEIKQNANK